MDRLVPPETWFSHRVAAVLGTGIALPGPAVATERLLDQAGLEGRQRSLAKTVADRLGIRTRHVGRSWSARIDALCEGADNPTLAARAVGAALNDAGLQVSDLGYLIGHTATPAQPLPGNITFVADRLGYRGPHVELRQACTGFANALMIAMGLLSAPNARPVAIVGSETGSVFLDLTALADEAGQIVNLVQMGDGAGAIVLGPPAPGADRLSAAWFGTIGLDRSPGLQMRNGGSAAPGNNSRGPLGFEHDFSAVPSSSKRASQRRLAKGSRLATWTGSFPIRLAARSARFWRAILGNPRSASSSMPIALVTRDRPRSGSRLPN